MKLLEAFCFPLGRPLRLVSLALVQSLFLWLTIAAYVAAFARPSNFKSIVVLVLLFGSALCNIFWLHSTSVASLQRVVTGQDSLAPFRLSDFWPRGIGPAIQSLVLIGYFVLFLGLAAMPTHVLRMVSSLGAKAPDEALSVIASHMLVIGLGTLVSLIFFVSLARYAAEGADLHIDVRSAGLFHPRRSLAASIRYLFRQFLLLGITAIAFNQGLQLLSAITPRDLGRLLDDPNATNWWIIVIFVICTIVLFFWHASLHLLADYVVETDVSSASS